MNCRSHIWPGVKLCCLSWRCWRRRCCWGLRIWQLEGHTNRHSDCQPLVVSQADNKFQATILVADLLNQGSKNVEVTDQTNAGMGGFEIKSVGDPV